MQPSAGTDASFQLLRRALSGDASALGRVFTQLMPELARWAHRRLPSWARSTMDTADLVQEAVAHALKRMPSFTPRHALALRSYLREAIRNRVRDEIRRVRTRGVMEPLSVAEPLAGESPYAETEVRESRDRYRRGLARLAEEDRELLVGRLQLGLSYEQLALATRRPSPDAARMAFKRALTKLGAAIDVP